MKKVELVQGFAAEPATTPDGRLFIDITIQSVAETGEKSSRIFRLSPQQLEMTHRALQFELDHLQKMTTPPGERH